MTEFCGPLMYEQTVFVNNLHEWLHDHSERWVWISGKTVKFYNTYTEAINSAHKEGFIKEPIFIEEIVEGYQLKLFPGQAYL